MRKLILCVSVLVGVSMFASAESSVWKVQKDKSVMYLGGTCHILREADYPLPGEFDKAYKAAEVVVFETDISRLKDLSTQQKLLSRAVYTDGSTIDKHLSTKAYGALRTYCATNGIALVMFKQFKPAMLIVTLTVMELMKMGVTQEGVDMHFHQLALKDGKTIRGLETVDEQINYIVTMADGNEDDFVTYSIEDMKNVKEQFETLAGAWKRGDADKLDELMIAELKTRLPGLYRKLIVERNNNWIPAIEEFQKTPKVEFIMVGVAHLVGSDGIVEQLKKKGYTVEKL